VLPPPPSPPLPAQVQVQGRKPKKANHLACWFKHWLVFSFQCQISLPFTWIRGMSADICWAEVSFMRAFLHLCTLAVSLWGLGLRRQGVRDPSLGSTSPILHTSCAFASVEPPQRKGGMLAHPGISMQPSRSQNCRCGCSWMTGWRGSRSERRPPPPRQPPPPALMMAGRWSHGSL